MNLSKKNLVISFSCIIDMPLIVFNGWLWLVGFSFSFFFIFRRHKAHNIWSSLTWSWFSVRLQSLTQKQVGISWRGTVPVTGASSTFLWIVTVLTRSGCCRFRGLQFFCVWFYPSGDMDWTFCLFFFFSVCLRHIKLWCHLSWELFFKGVLKATRQLNNLFDIRGWTWTWSISSLLVRIGMSI